MSPEPLDLRTALVTGASRGIGRAILKRLATTGLTVHGTATAEPGVAEVTKLLASLSNGGRAHRYDASALSAAGKLAKAVGNIDILVCNAGVTRDNLALRMSDDEWNSVIGVNLSAPFALVRAFSRAMLKRRGGRIIMISSVVATTGNAGQSNYCAAKAGLEGLVRSLAREYAGRNITVNAVAPGFIATDMTHELLNSDIGTKILAQIPLGRAGSVEEIAAATAFLASPEAGYITGSTLAVNGGMAMG